MELFLIILHRDLGYFINPKLQLFLQGNFNAPDFQNCSQNSQQLTPQLLASLLYLYNELDYPLPFALQYFQLLVAHTGDYLQSFDEIKLSLVQETIFFRKNQHSLCVASAFSEKPYYFHFNLEVFFPVIHLHCYHCNRCRHYSLSNIRPQ